MSHGERCLGIDYGILSVDHFHVHIVNANLQGSWGMAVGQAHLLDDVISLVGLTTLFATPFADGHWDIA